LLARAQHRACSEDLFVRMPLKLILANVAPSKSF